MAKVLGKLKLISCFILFGGALVAIKDYINSYETTTAIIVGIIFGFYIYYLGCTAIWNLGTNIYKLNILVLIGIFFHFLIMLVFIFLGMEQKVVYKISALCSAAIGLVLGFYDLKKVYKGRKDRQSAIKM